MADERPSALKTAIACRCPRCGLGRIYPQGFNLSLRDACPHCGLNLSNSDSADGPAVFLIFLLGFLLVPLALLFESLLAPPLWLHAILWGTAALSITIGLLRPLKAYVIALQYRHRPGDWE